MVRRPVEALLASRTIEPDPRPRAAAGAHRAMPCPTIRALSIEPSGKTIAATLEAFCVDPATQWPLLVTTADHALLDTGDDRRFSARRRRAPTSPSAWSSDARCCKRLPQTQRTWLSFRGGAYTRRQSVRCSAAPKVRPGGRAVAVGRAGPQEGLADARCAWARRLCSARCFACARSTRRCDRIGRKLGLSIRAVELADPARRGRCRQARRS